jgi:uncharacterized repeat protein (TIGR01451 family)
MMTSTQLMTQPAFTFFIAAALFLGPGIVQAKQEPKLELKTKVEKEIKVKRNQQWVLERQVVDKAAPGDVVVYTVTYVNAGSGDVANAVIVNPIPKGVLVIPQSAEGKDAEVTFSIDNNRSYYPQPVMMKMKKPDGSLESKPAPLDIYTHVRWTIKKPVPPGQSGQVSFKATIR